MGGGSFWIAVGGILAGFYMQMKSLKKGTKALEEKVEKSKLDVTEAVLGQGVNISCQLRSQEKLLKDALRGVANLQKMIAPTSAEDNEPEQAPFTRAPTPVKVEDLPKQPLGKVIVKP